MADRVDPQARAQLMSRIRGKDTGPELLVRSGLYKRGFRFRLHDGKLPGKPDLVFRQFRAVIFVNGCFWHGHECTRFKWPKTNVEFWKNKIGGNRTRDLRNQMALEDIGWRVGIVWECAFRGPLRLNEVQALDALAGWIRANGQSIVLSENDVW